MHSFEPYYLPTDEDISDLSLSDEQVSAFRAGDLKIKVGRDNSQSTRSLRSASRDVPEYQGVGPAPADKRKDICSDKCGCYKGKVVTLRQCDFNSGKTVRITCPGTYQLCEDVTFSPVSECISAIEVYSDNVLLDLNCHQLKQEDTTANVAGVYLTEHQNVKVTNGVVRGFSQIGVVVEGGSDNVVLDDLLVTENGFNSGEIRQGTLDDDALVIETAGFFVGGIALGNTSRYGVGPGLESGSKILTNSRLNNVRSNGNYNCGIGLFNMDGVEISNSQFNENIRNRLPFVAPNSVNGICAGAFLSVWSFRDFTAEYSMRNSKITNCQFNLNRWDWPDPNVNGGVAIRAVGLGGIGGVHKNVLVENSQFNGNKSNYAGSGTGSAEGIISGRFQNWTFDNCQFNNNSSPKTSEGHHISAFEIPTNTIQLVNSVRVTNCDASGNQALNPAEGTTADTRGFAFFYFESLQAKCLKATENKSVFEVVGSRSRSRNAGIYIVGSSTTGGELNNILIEDSYCANNITNAERSSTFDRASGILAYINPENIVLKNNTVLKNGNAEFGWGSGITVARRNNDDPPAAQKNVAILNNVVSGNIDVGILVLGVENPTIKGNNVKDSRVGIQLDELRDVYAVNAVVLDNCIDNNSEKGLVNLEPVNTGFISRNISFKNGTGHADAFSVTPPVPVIEGTTAAFPASTGYENLSIIQA